MPASRSTCPRYASAAAGAGAGVAAAKAGAGAGVAAAEAGEGAGAPAADGRGAAAAALVSRTRITRPWLTRSPTATLSSLTVPAAGEGTSMVALSDSREMSGSSGFTASPAFTNTWMTGTSLKSPMSGTFTSWVAMTFRSPVRVTQSAVWKAAPPYRRLEHRPAHVGEQLREIGGEAGRRGAVDHPVIVGERQRQHEPRHELRAVPQRLVRALRDAEDRDLR